MFRRLAPSHVKVIDGNIGTVNNLKRILEEMNALNEGNGDITYYDSGSRVEDTAELDKYNRLFERLDNINETSIPEVFE
jgi:glutamate racemase